MYIIIYRKNFCILAELGDYNPDENPPGYTTQVNFLPPQHLTEDMEKKVTELHKLHRWVQKPIISLMVEFDNGKIGLIWHNSLEIAKKSLSF